MKLRRKEIEEIIITWINAWNNHKLSAVMDLFHQDAVFISWAGKRICGKRSIQRAWSNWFVNHCGFYFSLDLIVIDELKQIATIQWKLSWPSQEIGYLNQDEVRCGVDILKFQDGLLISKMTYSQTAVFINAKKSNCMLKLTKHFGASIPKALR